MRARSRVSQSSVTAAAKRDRRQLRTHGYQPVSPIAFPRSTPLMSGGPALLVFLISFDSSPIRPSYEARARVSLEVATVFSQRTIFREKKLTYYRILQSPRVWYYNDTVIVPPETTTNRRVVTSVFLPRNVDARVIAPTNTFLA